MAKRELKPVKPVKREFFASFPGFVQIPSAPVSKEFARLTEARGWKPGSKKWKKNWNNCMQAEYDRLIGNRTTSLETWQHLCRKIGLDDSLPSIWQCKLALSRVHVNIVDLLDCWDIDCEPGMFPTLGQLANYTAREHMYFNRAVAKQDKVLRVLLKKLS